MLPRHIAGLVAATTLLLALVTRRPQRGRQRHAERPDPGPVPVHAHPGRPGGPAGLAAAGPCQHPRPRQGAGHASSPTAGRSRCCWTGPRRRARCRASCTCSLRVLRRHHLPPADDVPDAVGAAVRRPERHRRGRPGLPVPRRAADRPAGLAGRSGRQPAKVYARGTLAMANAGPDTNGSQFFLVYKDSRLRPNYTIFGRILPVGLRTLDRIAAGGVDPADPGAPLDGLPALSTHIYVGTLRPIDRLNNASTFGRTRTAIQPTSRKSGRYPTTSSSRWVHRACIHFLTRRSGAIRARGRRAQLQRLATTALAGDGLVGAPVRRRAGLGRRAAGSVERRVAQARPVRPGTRYRPQLAAGMVTNRPEAVACTC